MPVLLTLLLAGGRTVPVWAVPQVSQDYPRFLADAVSRLGPDGKPRILVAINICHDGLHFEKDAGGFQALLEYSLIAYDRKGRQVAGDSWRRRVQVSTYEATLSDTSCERELLTLDVAPGPHTVAVMVADRRSGERSRLEFPVLVGGKEEKGWRLNDIIFRQAPRHEEGADTTAAAGIDRSAEGAEDVFNPSRSYGEGSKELLAEVELYAEHPTETFPPPDLSVEYRIEDWQGKEVADGEAQLVASSPSRNGGPAWARFLVRYPIDELGRGRYSLRVACRGGPLGKGKLTQQGTFDVKTSAAFWKRDFLEAVETLVYIASDSELAQLRRAPVRERKAAWRAFWNRRDPTPATERNEWEEEYMRRVDYANHNLGTFHQEGWRTDRGKIYILKGPPDDIDRTGLGTTGSMEVWHYYRSGEVYYFVDETGFGEYHLRNQSTQ